MPKLIDITIQPTTKTSGVPFPVLGEKMEVQIDALALTYLNATTYADADGNIGLTDLKISTDNGQLAIETFGNGVDVLQKLADARGDGLAHKFVQVTRVDQSSEEPQINPTPEIVSVPDFLNRAMR